MVGKEGNWVGMGVAAPCKIVILGLARGEYHEIAPGKRAFLYFARVERRKLPLANGKKSHQPGANTLNQPWLYAETTICRGHTQKRHQSTIEGINQPSNNEIRSLLHIRKNN